MGGRQVRTLEARGESCDSLRLGAVGREAHVLPHSSTLDLWFRGFIPQFCKIMFKPGRVRDSQAFSSKGLATKVASLSDAFSRLHPKGQGILKHLPTKEDANGTLLLCTDTSMKMRVPLENKITPSFQTTDISPVVSFRERRVSERERERHTHTHTHTHIHTQRASKNAREPLSCPIPTHRSLLTNFLTFETWRQVRVRHLVGTHLGGFLFRAFL